MPAPTRVGSDRLLTCSPGRIVLATLDPESGQKVVCKLFEQGTLADAERELALAQAAPHDGVVPHLRAERDAATGLPSLVTAWVQAPNLETTVLLKGRMLPAAACRLLAPVAHTLAQMHAGGSTRAAIHGDLTPRNILCAAPRALLLDFEHAAYLGDPSRPGTKGFAAPEAGSSPAAPAIDVYALGAVLAFCLSGWPRARWRLPRELHELLAQCAAAPERRPTAAQCAKRLEHLAGLADPDVEEDLSETRARIHALLPDLPAAGRVAADADADAERSALRRVHFALRGHPNDAGLLAQRVHLAHAIAERFAAAGNVAAEAARQETFANGLEQLRALGAAVAAARRLPGFCEAQQPADPRRPEPMQRDPLGYLATLTTHLLEQQADLVARERSIDDGERALHLAAAEQALAALTAERGGASPAAIRRRDQLHRLAFHLDRVARAGENVERLTQLWDAATLQPLAKLVERAAEFVGERREAQPLGLRSLSVTLTNLVDEFPHLAECAVPAREALDAALLHTTELAWSSLSDAERMLDAVPVPVRPIQLALGRLDALRILEAIVDQPQRPRSNLLDGTEQLRLHWEEARATRDRLTHSAERALARGHWTTGLYDMERAVQSMGDTEAPEARELRKRLQEAKSRKQAMEEAVRRNVELATRYRALLDDSGGDFAARLQTLTERRDRLQFLLQHVQQERRVLYARDLRDVNVQLALERADLAQNQFDHTIDLDARLSLALRTANQLEESLRALAPDEAPPGRVVRAFEHWQRAAADCQQQKEQRLAANIRRQRRRLLLGLLLLLGGGVLLFALLR